MNEMVSKLEQKNRELSEAKEELSTWVSNLHTTQNEVNKAIRRVQSILADIAEILQEQAKDNTS